MSAVAVERLPDAAAFLAIAGDALREREVEHNLMLGIAGGAAAEPTRWADPRFLVVRRDGRLTLAAVRTPPYNLVISSAIDPTLHLEPSLDALADGLARLEPTLPGVIGPTGVATPFAAAWARRTGASARLTVRERLFRLDAPVAPQHPAAGRPRLADAADVALVAGWLDAFRREAVPDDPAPADPLIAASRWCGAVPGTDQRLYLWEVAGRPVACAGAHASSGSGVRIGPVYTPPDGRGHGYGTAVTHAATVAELARGARWTCLYTDLANPTSNAIYQRIGYRPVGDVDLYRFGDGADADATA